MEGSCTKTLILIVTIERVGSVIEQVGLVIIFIYLAVIIIKYGIIILIFIRQRNLKALVVFIQDQ